MAVEYSKQRFTFGRAIGSYQAIDAPLVEVLRTVENARSLLYYRRVGRRCATPAELALAGVGCAERCRSRVPDEAARANLSVHGGIGATWEHDARTSGAPNSPGGCWVEPTRQPIAWLWSSWGAA